MSPTPGEARPVRLQPLTRGKVAALGEAGRAWQAALPEVLSGLAERWDLEWGRPLPGGSASYVCGARRADGTDVVVKVVLPDPDLHDESRVLAAAAGRGYVVLHDHAVEHRALLLERLGPSLETGGSSPETTLDRLADALGQAWRVPLPAGSAAPDRAGLLLDVLVRRDRELEGPCPPTALREARACAERLRTGDDPSTYVVVHGDPHPGNALRVLDPAALDRGSEWVFVDPDALVCDPAYDVGVALRDWTGRLEGSDARALLAGWTARICERTGTDPSRAADWAYLERVSTGLYVLSLGADRLGRRFLDSAAALL